MHSISPPLSAAQSETYFREEFSRASYFTEHGRLRGNWGGNLAEKMGLADEIQQNDWAKLNHGLDTDGRVLVPPHTVSGETSKRAAWDCHFSFSKSLSIAALNYGDERLIAAHEQTAQECMTDLERYAQVRQHGGRERVTTGNLIYGMFTHYYARPVEGQNIPDPQVHSHFVMLNMSERPDGKIVALEPRELYRSQTWIQSLYQNRMAEKVKALGYEITYSGPGMWEIKGDGKAFSKEHLELWSKRSQQIKNDLNALKDSDPANAAKYQGSKAKEYAAHRNRQAKNLDFTHAELVQSWQKTDQEHGFDSAQRIVSRARERAFERGKLLDSTEVREAAARQAVIFSMDHNSERQAVFSERSLEEHAANHVRDKATIADIRAAIKEQLANGELLLAANHAFPSKANTTRAMLQLEQENIDWVKQGAGKFQPICQNPELFGLDADQTRTAAFALSSPHKLTIIQGVAGSGKSQTLSAIKREAERSGWEVLVLTPTTKPARDFRSAGITAETIDTFLLKNEQQPKTRTLYFVDEMGLASTSKFHRLKERLGAEDRMIGVGDSHQNKPIAAGQPLVYLPAARESLDKIHRQKDPQLLEAAQFFSEGRMTQGLEVLEKKTDRAPAGRIHEFRSDEARRAWVAEEYAKNPNGSLVITATRVEAKEINQMVRSRLQQTGQVSHDEIKSTILVGRDVTGPQREIAANYHAGDVLYYRTGSKAAGIGPGTYAEVKAIRIEDNILSVVQRGREIAYDPRRLKGVEIYSREERSFAIGDRFQTTRAIGSQGIANGDFGTITGIDKQTGTATIAFDDHRHRTIRMSDVHGELGYAATNAKSQGSTLRSGFLSLDGKHASQENLYVPATRFREDFHIAVTDKARMYMNANRFTEKTHAHRAVELIKGTPLQHEVSSKGLGFGF